MSVRIFEGEKACFRGRLEENPDSLGEDNRLFELGGGVFVLEERGDI